MNDELMKHLAKLPPVEVIPTQRWYGETLWPWLRKLEDLVESEKHGK